METTNYPSWLDRLLPALLLTALIIAAPSIAHAAAGSGGPWDPPMAKLVTAVQSLMFYVAVFAVVALCIALAFNHHDLGPFIKGLMVVLIISAVGLSATTSLQYFNVAGAVI